MKNSSNLFYEIYSIALVLLLYLMSYFNSTDILYVYIILIIPLISKPIYILPSYVISSLSGSLFSLTSNVSISRYISILLIISILFRLILDNRLKKNGIISSSSLALILVYNFFSSAFSVTSSFNTFFLMLQNLLIFYLLPKLNCNNKQVYRLIFLSGIILFIGIIINTLNSGIDILLLKDRLSIDENVNENRFAMMIAQIGAISISAIFITNKDYKFKSLGFIGFMLSFLMIILSGSRSALLGILFSVIVTILLITGIRSSRSILTIIVLVIGILFLWGFIEDLNLPFIERFTLDNIIKSQGSNRLPYLLIEINQIIPNHFLFGVGLGGENILAAGKVFNLAKPGHNMFIDTFTQIGLIGFFIYLVFIGKAIIIIVKNVSKDRYLFLPLLMILTAIFNGLGENMFSEKLFWNSLAIGGLMLNNILIEKKLS